MTHQFQAIYENGILRPLTPLELPEHACVSGTLQEAPPTDKPSAADLQRQQEALDAMFREIDALPQVALNDGLSNRDHDKILYGSPQ